MSEDKPISILLVEDDKIDCINMQNYINSRDDVKLVATVDSEEAAIEAIKTYLPDAIILDLELNHGAGSGIAVINTIKQMRLDITPIIVITTNILSKTVYAYAHENGVDMIFHKLKDDYSPDLIIRNIMLLNETKKCMHDANNRNKNVETMRDYKERIHSRINRELDLIGISSHLTGRKYILDSIIYILEEGEEKENVFLHLAKKYKKGNSTIGRSIQTAIEHAWRKSSIEDLENYYTAAVNYNTGVPTPTELIYYYVEKIKKEI